MNPGSRRMLKLKRGYWIAFAELEHRDLLLKLRAADPRMKRGRIVEVLQCGPSAVNEGEVYEETRR